MMLHQKHQKEPVTEYQKITVATIGIHIKTTE